METRENDQGGKQTETQKAPAKVHHGWHRHWKRPWIGKRTTDEERQ